MMSLQQPKFVLLNGRKLKSLLLLVKQEKHPLPLCFVPTKEIPQGEEMFFPDRPSNIISQGKFHKAPIIIDNWSHFK
jgi:hypothetical protein